MIIINFLAEILVKNLLGDLIGFGQSGSVYELWLATASKNATSSSEVSEFHSSKESSLALKAIHNFDFNQPVEHSLDENRCELLPLIDSNFLGTGVMMRFAIDSMKIGVQFG